MKKLLLLCLFSSFALASEVIKFDKGAIRHRESLGNINLLKKDKEFFVEKDGVEKLVKSYDMDELLKKADKRQLLAFIEQQGHIEISQTDNADYILRSKGRINGGGPVLAWIGYWGVKAFGYGVPAAVTITTVATASTVVVPTLAVSAAGGAIGGATAGGVALTGVALTTAIPATATVGATVAGAATIGAVGVQGAAVAVGGAMAATGGSVAAYVAAVESAAAATSLALLAVPFI